MHVKQVHTEVGSPVGNLVILNIEIADCLKGAGWGGCTVSLVPETEVENFITKIKNAYGPYKGLEGERLHEVIFATKPSSGACGTYHVVCMERKVLILVSCDSL